MSYLSARRMLSGCIVSAAAVVVLAAPGTASATTDLTEQCSGSNIKGLGSTFQAPAQAPVWNVDFNLAGNTNALACAGTQGSGTGKDQKPTVTYESTGANSGSGACLKDFGDGEAPRYGVKSGEDYPFCGTDEAPSASALTAMEADNNNKETEKESIESVPVLQGAVAVIVHLPEFCKAKDEVKETTTGTKLKQGRLALDDMTIAKIYRGEIKDWKEVMAAQGTGHGIDTMTCKYPVLSKVEPFQSEEEVAYQKEAEEDTINVVVRTDKSGTTHIFKSFLAQVEEANSMAEFKAETFPLDITEENAAKENACKEAKAEELKTFKDVQEGCENQRWPAATHIVRPVYRPGSAHQKLGYKGNPGVVYQVATTPSSIGYADLAVAREENAFSANCLGAKAHPASECGGENLKGTETKQGEQSERFWAVMQNSEVAGETYTDPSSTGDIEKAAQSNCASTVFIGNTFGEPIPPESTRKAWNTVKGKVYSKTYAVCGLTYDLALRVYKPFLEHIHSLTSEEEEVGKHQAQTTRDYLLWEVNAPADGGGAYIKNHDYEKLPTAIQKKAEEGIKEIGWAIG
jgi:ABC-type phosphate transport system substrate-binding protein